jgi:thermitase
MRMEQKTRFVLSGLVAICVMCRVVWGQQEVVPNDPYFKDQVSFKSPGGRVVINYTSAHLSPLEFNTHLGIDLNITKAWAITTGNKNAVVAILDDGFCYTHPDIRDNIWHNPGESGKDGNGLDKETNAIDDDHNGYVDDIVGWDFVFDTPDVDCHVFDGMDKTRIAPYPHSMGAMGIIGAKGNNSIGVAGINWNVSMMLLRIGVQGIRRDEHDLARIDRVVRAIHYAADNGARIINWSGFVNDARPEKIAELRAAIEYAASKDVLVVVGAGNDAKDLDENNNCSHAPQCFEGDDLMKIAEIDFDGNLCAARGNEVGGSNYGAKRVDIAAIAMNYTTDVTKGGIGIYRLAGGTSNAAPVVSGVAALMLSVNPSLTAAQLKRLLTSTARPLPALRGKTKSGGIVDAYAAVNAARDARK